MTQLRSLLRLAALGGLLSTSALAQEVVEDAVCVDTNVGEFCMEMLPDRAPQTVENFLRYLNDGDFNNTFIHRSVPGFVIQGGGYFLDPLGQEVPQDAPVPNEYGLSNTRGTVAMAKLGNDPNSATSEWFVNVRDNSSLNTTNGGFTVFARIIKGMDIVDTINSYGRVNLASSLGGAFQEVPVLPGTPASAVDVEHLIQVTRVYVTDVIPEEDDGPGEADPDNDYPAVTTLRNGSSFRLPLHWVDSRWGETFVTATFNRAPGAPEGSHVYRMSTGSLVLLNTPPDARGLYDADAGTLTIPSVNVGANTYVNVVLRRTDAAVLEFTLESQQLLTP